MPYYATCQLMINRAVGHAVQRAKRGQIYFRSNGNPPWNARNLVQAGGTRHEGRQRVWQCSVTVDKSLDFAEMCQSFTVHRLGIRCVGSSYPPAKNSWTFSFWKYLFVNTIAEGWMFLLQNPVRTFQKNVYSLSISNTFIRNGAGSTWRSEQHCDCLSKHTTVNFLLTSSYGW